MHLLDLFWLFKITFIINIQCLNGMVPDMIAVYHLQKYKGTGVYTLTWNRQITPIQTHWSLKFSLKVEVSEAVWGAQRDFSIDHRKTEKNAFRWENWDHSRITVGQHLLVRIGQQGPTCSILTPLLCIFLSRLTISLSPTMKVHFRSQQSNKNPYKGLLL